MLITKSLKKSRIMKKIEKIQKTSIKQLNNSFSSYFKNSDKMKEEEKMAFKELYQCMKDMNGMEEYIIYQHLTTAEELMEISHRIGLAIGDYKGHYLPVALVSFAGPLEYILCNKEIIMKKNINEIMGVVMHVADMM